MLLHLFRRITNTAYAQITLIKNSTSSPHELSLSIAVGCVGGCFPVPGLGAQSLMTLCISKCTKANIVISQAINIITGPLVPLFLYFFMYIGSILNAHIFEKNNTTQSQWSASHMVCVYIAWVVLSPFIAIFIYFICRLCCRLYHREIKMNPQS